jgi:bifunctional DNA-binding transcriptional regulator/antitoxin component of YhaV-PrlF toxin-antitoxin module
MAYCCSVSFLLVLLEFWFVKKDKPPLPLIHYLSEMQKIRKTDMADTMIVQMAQRGVLILPKALRDSYNLQPGDSFTLLDLGGVFVLSPRRSEIDSLAGRLTQALTERGETLEMMLQALRGEGE